MIMKKLKYKKKSENDDQSKQKKMKYVNKETMLTRFFAMNEQNVVAFDLKS